MRSEDFEFLADMLKRRSGLMLTKDKVYLLESRLTPLARKQGFESLDDFVTKVRMSRSEPMLVEITEAMTTNESFFFRDNTPFDIFKQHVLPAVEKSKTDKKLRIWCAAASTGQEPYSLAMILKEQWHKWKDWRIEIIGTDICTKVLDKAKKGHYSQFEVQRGLPIQMLIKYFEQDGDVWKISDEIKRMVTYRPFNLLDPFTALGRFDVIYCRNVLIYFDQPTKTDVLERMHRVLNKDGTLFLGAAETVLGITDTFKPVRGQRGMYVPSDGEAEKLMGFN